MRSVLLLLLVMLTGCVTLSEQGSRVRVVSNPDAVKGCKYLAQVTSSSSWGGLASGLAFDNAMAELKNKTAQIGGDTAFTSVMLSSWGGTRIVGDAYACQ